MSVLGEWDDGETFTVEQVRALLSAEVLAQLDLAAGEQVSPSPDGEAALFYPTVAAFVTEQLAPTYRRHLGDGRNRTWCPRWWAHAEAVDRLVALWRAWEHLRLDAALGMTTWWRLADENMDVLLDPDGPFRGCKPTAHGERLAPLPCEEPPPDLFA